MIARGGVGVAKMIKQGSSRKPPEPSDGHGEIDYWMRRVMPDLNPVVRRIDEMIREAHQGLQYALKWKKAYYGLPERGWIIELVAYDVSVNVVFLGGGAFDSPPPMGEGASRYVKVRSVEEADTQEMRSWIAEAGRHPGWR
jgi:hypothetical protein